MHPSPDESPPLTDRQTLATLARGGVGEPLFHREARPGDRASGRRRRLARRRDQSPFLLRQGGTSFATKVSLGRVGLSVPFPFPLGTRLGAGSALFPEELSVELARLGRGQARSRKRFDRFVRDVSLLGRQRWRIAIPAQTCADVLMEPDGLAGQLVSDPVELPHLIQK